MGPDVCFLHELWDDGVATSGLLNNSWIISYHIIWQLEVEIFTM